MAAAPKLTAEQWSDVQLVWSRDARSGYVWLVAELQLPVSEAAVRKRARAEGWVKTSDAKTIERQKEPAVKKQRLEDNRKERSGSKKASRKPANHGSPEDCSPREPTNLANLGGDAAVISRDAARGMFASPGDWSDLADSDGEYLPGPGRPTLFRAEYAPMAFKLCLMGFTDAELADFFLVSESTINNWKREYPEFLESVSRGKVLADGDVARGLYQRAVGCSHPDVHISVFMGEATITPYERHYPPDVAAARFWLTNRQPKRWKNKVEVPIEVDLSTIPTQATMREVYEQSLARSEEKAKEILGDRMGRLGMSIDEDGEDD